MSGVRVERLGDRENWPVRVDYGQPFEEAARAAADRIDPDTEMDWVLSPPPQSKRALKAHRGALQVGKTTLVNFKRINEEHFPTRQSGVVDLNIEVVRLNPPVDELHPGRNVAVVLKKLGSFVYRPATPRELFALGAVYKTDGRLNGHRFVSLSDYWLDCESLYIQLTYDEKGVRELDLTFYEDGGFSDEYIAVVKK